MKNMATYINDMPVTDPNDWDKDVDGSMKVAAIAGLLSALAVVFVAIAVLV